MSDLIERLRFKFTHHHSIDQWQLCHEAANALEALAGTLKIEQAVLADRDAEIEKLLETETLNQQIVIGELRKGWEAKEAEIDERLRAALEFYANRDNYVLEGEGSAIDADDGEIARKALEGK